MDSTEMPVIAGVTAEVREPAWGAVEVGDSLIWASKLVAGSFDFVYVDPPFFTNRELLGAQKGPLKAHEALLKDSSGLSDDASSASNARKQASQGQKNADKG